MFEQPASNVEKDRSRLIIVLSGVAVVIVIGLIVLVGSRKVEVKEDLARAGSPEFDSYSEYVKITNVNKRTGERLGNSYGRIIARIENSGERVLAALQIRAMALDREKKVMKENRVNVVPLIRDALEPNQSMQVDVYLDPINPDLLADLTLEVSGLRLK